jgi:4-hydroxy-tetrahydrodipicolinate synthase
MCGLPKRGLVAFFMDLANRTELPFLIYHIPGRAAVSVNAGTFEAIAESWPILTVLFTSAKIRE